MPRTPGRFRLQTPDGRVRKIRVIEFGGVIYAVLGWWIFSVATPIESVEGEWLAAA